MTVFKALQFNDVEGNSIRAPALMVDKDDHVQIEDHLYDTLFNQMSSNSRRFPVCQTGPGCPA